MKAWMKWTLAFGMTGLYVACSPKQFSKDPGFNACQNSGQNCVSENGRDYFSVSETVAGGKIDVLVVTDNSASMSAEQAALASRFSDFIGNLDGKKIDYRIGVVTTDISSAENKPRSINKNGALQDGKLIAFPSGAFLTKESGTLSQKDAAFKSVVQRQETLACESFILSELSKCSSQGLSKEQCIERPSYMSAYDTKCVSGDERGIFAARLVMENNPSGFIRKDADLAVIVLSDEDVRGGLYRHAYASKGETHVLNSAYAMTNKDSADSFTSFMSSKYANKKYNVHSITVPYYTDPGCRAVQAAQTGGVVGSTYGTQYENLSAATGGIRGSICDSNYSVILQSIFDQVKGQILDKVALACSNPPDVTVSLTGPSGSTPSVAWTVVGDQVRFASKLAVGTTVKVTYSCETM
ncbi:MAG: hypothetical protein KF789_06230 [Bdellovibrionaceae bacterium]|nr:hypothetical protein [Pseudobdellovibrionaceae bacterium]